MSGGTFNVSRDLWEDTAFRDMPFTEREAWAWMIAEASWKARERRIDDFVVQLERGDLAASVRHLADVWQWSKSSVHRFLERLKKRDMIRTESGTGILVISICNYSKYQSGSADTGTPKPRRVGHHRDTTGTKQKKGERRGKEESTAADASEAAAADDLPTSEEAPRGGKVIPLRPEPQTQPTPTFRERILAACGADKSGITSPSAMNLCSYSDFAFASRWIEAGLTEDECLRVIEHKMARKRTKQPPSTLRYFDEAMGEAVMDKQEALAPLPIPERRDTTPSPKKGRTNGQAAGFQLAIERRRARGMDTRAGDDPDVPLLPAGSGPNGRFNGR